MAAERIRGHCHRHGHGTGHRLLASTIEPHFLELVEAKVEQSGGLLDTATQADNACLVAAWCAWRSAARDKRQPRPPTARPCCCKMPTRFSSDGPSCPVRLKVWLTCQRSVRSVELGPLRQTPYPPVDITRPSILCAWASACCIAAFTRACASLADALVASALSVAAISSGAA